MWTVEWPPKMAGVWGAKQGARRAFLERWVGLQVGAWALLVAVVGLAWFYDGAVSPLANVARWGDRPGFLLLVLLAAGAGMGAVQWWGLRRHLEGAGWWLPATVGGVVLGYGLALLFRPVRPGLVLLLVAVLVTLFQAEVLRLNGPGARWWLLVKPAGLLFSPYNLWLAGWLWLGTQWLAAWGMLGVMVFLYLLVGLPYALVTGLFLGALLCPEA